MTSTNLEPNELGRSICYENKYIYKWNIHNFKCQYFPHYADLPTINFTFFLNGVKGCVVMKLEGALCEHRKITISCFFEQEGQLVTRCQFYVNLLIENIVILKSNVSNDNLSCSALLFKNKCLLPQDNITIFCEIIQLKCKVLEPYQKNIETKSKLSYSLVDLFENKHNWDVTFVVQGHEIHAHKCILAVRSKVFAAMFEHEMEESNLNRVTITDIDPEVFVEMLRFIYTDEVLILKKRASELLAASDKYDLQNLKSICGNELANSLSVENAAENLILADLYGVKSLKDYIINFINCHKKSVPNTEGWKQIVNKHTDLLAELYLIN